jgi:uncharacterized protein (TIGR03084 family)
MTRQDEGSEPTMQQAQDFLDECRSLSALLEGMPAQDWTRATQFKGWTVNDVIAHLHFWNRAADLSLTDPEGFAARIRPLMARIQTEGMRPVENAEIAERGPDLRAAWIGYAEDMAARWATLDPKQRVQWAGPEMSVRSSISARQMETWAHGLEIFDLLGETRVETDRIRNVVVLGVNAFGWSHKVHGLDVPETMPHLVLDAPSGEVWEFGDPSTTERIEGSAVEFAQVVTQTRNVADTDLRVNGPVATRWMQTAQCFAGPPETPPPPGTRFRRDDPH